MALITYLTRIQFDHGALALLADELKPLGIRRPLLVADQGVVAAGLLDRVLAALPPGMDSVLYDETPPNPTERAVLAAAARYREAACDGVIAVGGGSPIDLAKGVRLLATHPEPLAQYAFVEGGLARIRPPLAPMVAIPTTAGTGSEVGRAAIIVMADGRKLGVLSPHLIPSVAICDPELTLGLPPVLTAATGMDAVAHCIETYIAPAANPPAEAIALDGLTRAGQWLARATEHGSDREARWNMMIAATEGALAFQKGLGAVHALSHPLGGVEQLRLHHGTLNAVLLPAVLRFNRPASGDRYGRLGAALGFDTATDLPEGVAALTRRLGLPGSLSAMGVPEELLPAIAAAAPKDHAHLTNPRKATESDYLAMLRESF